MEGYQGNNDWQAPRKEDNSGFGIASLVLGIVSLLLFCTCVNWLTGILAIIFGIIQIVNYSNKGFAIGGIVTAGISMLFSIFLYALIFIGASESNMDYRDYYRYYYSSYDENQDSGSGQEFLNMTFEKQA